MVRKALTSPRGALGLALLALPLAFALLDKGVKLHGRRSTRSLLHCQTLKAVLYNLLE